ncbi:MAG: TonB-dependent receptor [Bacteroidia bacterium]
MKYFYTIGFLLISIVGFSQNTGTAKLSGGVADSASGNALPGASVTLLKGDVLVAGTIAESLGAYHFKDVEVGEYTLKVKMIGYRTLSLEVNLQNDMVLGTLFLVQSTSEIDGIEVQGQIAIGENRGDTSEYNSRAFKTHQNASAQDLLEKMPGVRNDNGTIKAEGENVQQVLVDGKPFFGQDVNTALGVLPAEVVDKIQIFDDQSEQSKASGVDDGTRIKTVNIVTKINMRNGEFGKVYAGGGTDERYAAGTNINVFRGDQRFSILGQVNNINMQNFSTSDLLGVVADNSGGRHHRRGPAFMRGFSVGSDASDFMVNPQNGIIQTLAGGINYQDQWSKKWEVSSSYFYNRSNTTAISDLYQLYFLSELDGQEYTENNESTSINTNHRFNAKLTYKLSENASFFILPSLSVQTNEGDEVTESLTSREGVMLSSVNSLFNSDYEAFNWSNDIMFRQKFAKAGRSLFVRGKVGQQNTSGTSDMISGPNWVGPILINQQADLSKDGFDLVGSIMYSEPIGDQGMNMFYTYDITNSQNNSDQLTEDLLGSESVLDSTLSNRYNNDWTTHMVGAGIRKFNKSFGFVLRFKYQISSLINEQSLPEEVNVNRQFNNIMPFALIRTRGDNGGSAFLMYRTYVSAPSASQLQLTVDNSNPLLLSTGNASLKQQFTHYLRLRYKNSDKTKSKVFFAGIRANFKENYIGNQSLIALSDTVLSGIDVQSGAQLSSPLNLAGYYSISSMVNFGFPVKALKSNLNIDLSNTASNIPSMINNELNNTLSSLYEFGVVLSSNISEKLDFTISSNSGYSLVKSDINDNLSNNYFIQRSRIKLDWVMPWGITFRSQLEHQQYFGLTEGLDNTVLLWTAGLGKQLFKDKRGEIQLSVFDILGQNNRISQNFYSTYYQESTSNVLTSYTMLTFSYNLRKFREGKIPDETENSKRPMHHH